MVLGESQILNQIKTAYGSFGGSRDPYHFKYAFSPRHYHGERVRTETRISTSAVSVSYAAVKMAEKF
ncbi:MAG: hypothetical protein ACLUIQ_04995 [Dialister invisus]